MSEPSDKATTVQRLRPSQEHFATLIARGWSQSAAYRKAYNKPRISAVRAANAGHVVAKLVNVQRRIAALRQASEKKTILTINDRLRILADTAQITAKTPSAHNARTKAIEVYNKTAGDHAPERHEHTVTTPPGAPFEIAPARPVSAKAKIAALVAAKLAAKEETFE